RVAIGRALIKNPNFLFADEPTSALDWAHGEQVIELLRNAAHERGATILVVAHDSRIIPYVDRVFYLEDGSLRDPEGSAADTRHAVLHCIGHVDVDGGVSFPYPTSPGRVVEVEVREGQQVKGGDVLFRMDDRAPRKDLGRAQNAVRTAELALTKVAND